MKPRKTIAAVGSVGRVGTLESFCRGGNQHVPSRLISCWVGNIACLGVAVKRDNPFKQFDASPPAD